MAAPEATPATPVTPSTRGYAADRHSYLVRLPRIESQVRGVQKMVADDRWCPDVVNQLAAITRATQEVAAGLLALRPRSRTRLRRSRTGAHGRSRSSHPASHPPLKPPHPPARHDTKRSTTMNTIKTRNPNLGLYAVAAAIALVGALWFGVPAGTLAFVGIALMCPLMMMLMMGE